MMSLTYGSICSGIEAATVAWHPMGHKAAWFAQFDPDHNYALGPDFPSLVLAERWPDVPNLGDMTTIAPRIRSGEVLAPELVVGGTPCQAFSIAGAREGLDDPRGALTLKYVELIDAIDNKRAERGEQPTIAVWENVPGVLTSKDNAFGCFLAALAGEDAPRVAPGNKWTDAGHVVGPKRAITWRILNAEYFGVAQRRRRVFVIASARTDFDSSTILLEFDGVRRDSPPSREAQQGIAADTAGSTGEGRELTACMAHGQGSAEIRLDDAAPTLTCNHESPIVFNNTDPGQWVEGSVSSTLRAGDRTGNGDARLSTLLTFPAQMSGTQFACADDDISQTLTALNPTAVCYDAYSVALRGREGGTTAELGGNVSTALRSAEGGAGKAHVLTMGLTTEQTPKFNAECALTLTKQSPTGGGQPQACLTSEMKIRRLLPVEYERLQGFPDHYTFIPVRKRKKITADQLAWLRQHFPDMPEAELIRHATDGPRYKALGNSMAVPVMRWLMVRITTHLIKQGVSRQLCEEEHEAKHQHVQSIIRGLENQIVGIAHYMANDASTLCLEPGGGVTITGLVHVTGDTPKTISLDDKPTSKNIDVLPLTPAPKKKTMSKKQKVIAVPYVRPFLKWPGGKYSVLDQVLPHLGEGKRLIEPFVGAGSVFLNAPQFERYLLGDTNRDLIGLFIGAGVMNVADAARLWFDGSHNSRDAFEGIRERFNDNKMGMAERAAAFLYLNRHAYNGLTRYNLKGRYNSPFGYYKAPYFPDAELATFKELYPRCDFKCQSFALTLAAAGAGDVVFCDPPYMPLPDSLGFTAYTKDPFTEADQWHLLNEMVQAAKRGARVVVTNSGAPAIHENYAKAGFQIFPLNARRSMSCQGKTRGIAADIIGVLQFD